MINALVYNATTIQFPGSPLRETSSSGDGFQVMGRDSSGNVYIYDKSRLIRNSHPLVYTQVPLATVTALLALQDSVDGDRYLLTWYDHDAASHQVRIMEIRFRETTSGRYRVELTLEEDVVWNPATDTGLLTTYAAPVWILKMTVNSVVYYLSDSTLAIAAWGITTKPWIAAWGRVQSGINGGMDEYQVADISATILIDPAANPNIETLALNYSLESTAAELYLYDCSGAVAPALKFSGYVSDVKIPDETRVEIMIEDASTRLQSVYIGRKLSLTDYPGADPDDIGKVIPIPYGTVNKVPALCIVSGWATSTIADVAVTDTSITVSMVPTASVVGKTIIIDDEKIYISGQSGKTLTVTRGYGGTSAAIHFKGSLTLEAMAAPIVYMVADCAVTSIGNIYTRVNGIDVDITTACTKYIGTSGNQHGSYPGKAVITLTDIPAIKNKINLTISETGHNHNSATSTTENTTLSLPYATVGPHYVPISASGYPYAMNPHNEAEITFPASGGTRSSCSYSVTFSPTVNRSGEPIVVAVAGVCKWWSYMNLVAGSPFTVTFTANAGSEANANSIQVYHAGGLGSFLNVTVSSRLVYLSSVPSTYALTGSSLSGNSVADTIIGEMLIADITRPKTVPQIYSELLTMAGASNTTLTAVDGAAAASIPISGAELVVNGSFDSGASWTLQTESALEQVVNGGFVSAANWSLLTGAQQVINGGFASAANWSLPTVGDILGSELILNGGFDSSTNWTLFGSTTINSGVLNASAAGQTGFASESINFTAGTYRVTVQITAYTAGYLYLKFFPAGAATPGMNAIGTYSYDVTITANDSFYIASNATGFTGLVDNISVKKIISTGPLFAVSSGVVTGATVINAAVIAQQTGISLVNGTNYTASFQIVSRSAGDCKLDIGGKYATALQTAAGTYTVNFTANATEILNISVIAGASGFSGSIDNVSCYQSVFTVSAGITAGSTAAASAVIAQQAGISLINGWSYTASFQIVSRTAGDCKLDIGGKYATALQNSAGTYTLNFTANATETLNLSIIAGASGFSGSLDNISCLKAAGTIVISSSRANFTTCNQLKAYQSGISLVSGYGYTVNFQLSNYSSGSALIDIGGKYVSSFYGAAGSYSFTFTANATETLTLYITPSASGYIGVADSISVHATSIEVPAVPAIYSLSSDTSLLNGVINEYRTAREWLNLLAFQLRSWFRYALSTPTLYVRPDTLASTKTLSACRVTDDGRKVHSRRKTDVSDLINKINLLYNRDWTTSGDGAYQKVLTGSDSASITAYGGRERPELFKFDWITGQTLAQSVLNFYLAYYHDRRWIHEFEEFLDQHGLNFADVVTLAFSGNKVGQVVNVGLNPGDSGGIDTVLVTVEE